MRLLAIKVLLVVGGIQLSTQCQFEQEVQRLLAVEGLEEFHDEGRIAQHLHILLAHDALLHTRLHDVALAQGLQGKGLAGLHVLHELHGPETAAAEETEPLEVLFPDRAELPLGCARGHHRHLAVADLALATRTTVLDLLQRPEQHVEGGLVQGQRHGGVGDDCDGGTAGFVFQEGLLSEKVSVFGGATELGLLLAVLDNADRAAHKDVEVVALFALIENRLTFREGRLHQCIGNLHVLVILQCRQHLDLLQIADVLRCEVVRRFGQDALEVVPVNDPDDRIDLGLDGGGSRGEVEQRQLAKAAACVDAADSCAGGLGALALLAGDEDLEAARLDDVKVVRVEVTLPDDIGTRSDLLLPRNADHSSQLKVVERHHGFEVGVRLESFLHERPLRSRLRGGRFDLDLLVAAADGVSLGELQFLLQAESLELLPRDPQSRHRGGRGDRRGPGLVAEQRVLAEIIPSFERCHDLPVDIDARRAGHDDEKLVSLIALLDHDLIGVEVNLA
mmetsp:Transcript_66630/g.216822  ORF Transcript_66630/g.216822 Transcript_66630/m.216822 type:complete len:505 (+) Transcript_66630:797-2311(+)